MVSKVYSAMLHGTAASIVTVEGDVSGGLPTVEMTGNMSVSVKDGKERIRAAIRNSGFLFPQGRVTINMAPASFRKEGTGFDVSMACVILIRMGIIRQEYFDEAVVVGELGLDGKIIGIRGVLAIVLEAKTHGMRKVIVPADNLNEARIVRGIQIESFAALKELIEQAGCDTVKNFEKIKSTQNSDNMITADASENKASDCFVEISENESSRDFADISGQYAAKKAVLVAVCGMHNILLMGPPGAGKTMLASRIPTIMPRLSYDEGMELTCVYSLAGLLGPGQGIITDRPFRAPHHSITMAAMAGGGIPVVPGEVSLSTKGVLFLDELTKFAPQVVELLREPLEEGRIVLRRVSGTYEFPAEFMLVTAINPCKCGYFPDRNKCRCSINEIKNHFGKISKPILDRIDMSIAVGKVEFEDIAWHSAVKNELSQYMSAAECQTNRESMEMTSEAMRKLVEETWKIQFNRFGAERFNSQMNTSEIEKYCHVEESTMDILKNAYERFDMSARAFHKVLKLSRTLADMEKLENIEEKHVLEALAYRIKNAGEINGIF